MKAQKSRNKITFIIPSLFLGYQAYHFPYSQLSGYPVVNVIRPVIIFSCFKEVLTQSLVVELMHRNPWLNCLQYYFFCLIFPSHDLEYLVWLISHCNIGGSKLELPLFLEKTTHLECPYKLKLNKIFKQRRMPSTIKAVLRGNKMV